MQYQQSDTQNLPLVTFIVTFYNLPTTMLRQCLDSIMALSLSRAEREVLLIDDGSEASPLPQLDSYAADIVYVRQPNGGLSEARNRGIQMATGQYVQFVDADDYLIRSPYEHCLDIARYQHPDIIMFDQTDEDDQKMQANFNTSDMESGAEFLSGHNLHASACGYLFKRTIIGRLRFTPGICHEDEEFTPQLLLRAETVSSTDAAAYFYRHRPHSITTETDKRKVVKRLNDKLQVIYRLNHIADTLPLTERIALGRRVAQLTMDFIYNVIVQTNSRHFLDRKLDELRRKGLFPLPDQEYTAKYKWFRRLTNSKAGLALLMNVLPMTARKK